MALAPGKLKHLKALSNKDGIIAAAAMDQRGSLQKSLASAKGVDQKAITWDMMSEFKTAVTRILTPHASAILLDPEFGLDAAKARGKHGGRPKKLDDKKVAMARELRKDNSRTVKEICSSTGFSNRLERFLLGSVSAAVANRAECSVEVVRNKPASEV